MNTKPAHAVCALLRPPARKQCASCNQCRPVTQYRYGRKVCMQCQAAQCKARREKRQTGSFAIEMALLLAVIGVVVALIVSAWIERRSAEDSVCIRHEIHEYLQPMIVGKSTILMPMPAMVCVEYLLLDGE